MCADVLHHFRARNKLRMERTLKLLEFLRDHVHTLITRFSTLNVPLYHGSSSFLLMKIFVYSPEFFFQSNSNIGSSSLTKIKAGN